MSDDHTILAGRHAVVTGGGQGIGAAVATELAQLGASLTLLGRHRETLESHAEQLRSSSNVKVFTVACDVTDESAVADAFARAKSELGVVAILINNAGVAPSALFRGTDRGTWDRTLAVNLTSVYSCSQQVVDDMVAGKWGRIVNIALTAGLRGYTRTAAYCASKHGVVGLTRALALELAKLGVTVNAVCPGYVSTRIVEDAIGNVADGMNKTPAEAREILLRTIPRKQFTSPEEVASLVGWLCTPAAAAVTGAALPVAGGEVT